MNPRRIAEALKDIGCPFPCDFIYYTVKLVYKKIDPTLAPDVLQLSFSFRGDSRKETTMKSLDYTYDMLASDYGAIFGLFLGLSLIDMIAYFFEALRSFAQVIVIGEGKNWKLLLKISYDLAKWSTINGLVGLLIVLTFSADIQNLISYIKKGLASF